MKKHVFEFLKTIAIAVLVIYGLKITGLLSGVTYVAQSALLTTGIMNASNEAMSDPEIFDYGFSIKDLKGKQLAFEQYKGKVLFINIWATWCGPCRAEMKGIQKLYDKIDNEKIQFVMLSVDRESDLDKVTSYVEGKAFTFPVFQRTPNSPRILFPAYIPTTLVVSKDGRIVSQEVGTTNFNTTKFQKFLEQLAAQ